MDQDSEKRREMSKPVAANTQSDDIFGCLRDEIEGLGDIVSPAVALEDWETIE